MTVSQSEATRMSVNELMQLGRFNLRVLAQGMGLLDTDERRNNFIALDSTGQAEVLFRELRPAVFSKAWANESWISDLFLEYSMLKSITEREEAYNYSHAYVITANVVLADGPADVSYLIIKGEPFSKAEVAKRLDALLEDGPSPSSRWLGEVRGRMGCTVDRAALKHGVDFPGYGILSDAETAEEFAEVMDKHGAWMLGAMQTWTAISAFGRRGNKSVSPNTYLIELDVLRGANQTLSTWMKYPDVEKIRRRIKLERHRWKPLSEHDRGDCRLIITREMVFYHYKIADKLVDEPASSRLANHNALSVRSNNKPTRAEVDAMTEEATAKGHQRRQPPRDKYIEARNELVQKLVSNGHTVDDPEKAVAIAMLNEDQAGDAWHPEVPTHTGRLLAGLTGELVVQRTPNRDSRFDPRPGIDDVGLGFSSPSYED